jgi:hypothetical protein
MQVAARSVCELQIAVEDIGPSRPDIRLPPDGHLDRPLTQQEDGDRELRGGEVPEGMIAVRAGAGRSPVTVEVVELS